MCSTPVTQRWSIYWLDNLTGGLDPAAGLLLPPVVGGFQGGVGLFEGEELFEGRPVRVRFEGRRCTPPRAALAAGVFWTTAARPGR